ncbi:MAG: hypothetical protein IPP37_17190 [Saprospiraceae bacterium]|nr:hypothetical protein [Saprospiraceae bacterium]
MISYFEWLDDYMDGSLSQEDRLAFEKAMVSDEKLKHAVDNYNLLKKISASLIEEETRENLRAISEEKHKPTPVRKLNRWWLVAAAAIFIGLSTYWLISLSNLGSDHDKIMADLYLKPPITAHRGASGDSSRLAKAIDLFDGNYLEEATTLLLPTAVNDSLQIISNRYLAHIYLRTNRLQEADSLFVLVESTASFQQEAIYHRMVIALLLHDKEKAKRRFAQLDPASFSAKQLELVNKYLFENE